MHGAGSTSACGRWSDSDSDSSSGCRSGRSRVASLSSRRGGGRLGCRGRRSQDVTDARAEGGERGPVRVVVRLGSRGPVGALASLAVKDVGNPGGGATRSGVAEAAGLLLVRAVQDGRVGGGAVVSNVIHGPASVWCRGGGCVSVVRGGANVAVYTLAVVAI